MARLTGLAREGRLLAADEAVPPVDEALDHLRAASDTLTLLRRELLTESEALRRIAEGTPEVTPDA